MYKELNCPNYPILKNYENIENNSTMKLFIKLKSWIIYIFSDINIILFYINKKIKNLYEEIKNYIIIEDIYSISLSSV